MYRLFCTYIHSILYILFIQYSKDINSNLSVWCSSGSDFFLAVSSNSFTGAREIFLISSKRIELSKIILHKRRSVFLGEAKLSTAMRHH